MKETRLMFALFDLIIIYILPADEKIAQFLLNHGQGENDQRVLSYEPNKISISQLAVLVTR